MTVYMARLVSKLTQTAVNYSNNVIKKTEEYNHKAKSEVFAKYEAVKLETKDLVEFTSNLQLLDDEELLIPTVVQKIQALAKKHVECLTLMHSFSLNHLENSQQLLVAKKEHSERLEQLDDNRSKDAKTLISYSVNQLCASEDQVKEMLS